MPSLSRWWQFCWEREALLSDHCQNTQGLLILLGPCEPWFASGACSATASAKSALVAPASLPSSLSLPPLPPSLTPFEITCCGIRKYPHTHCNRLLRISPGQTRMHYCLDDKSFQPNFFYQHQPCGTEMLGGMTPATSVL